MARALPSVGKPFALVSHLAQHLRGWMSRPIIGGALLGAHPRLPVTGKTARAFSTGVRR